MPLTVHIELMDLGAEGLLHLLCGSGKVDQHAAWIIDVYFESMSLEPADHGFAIRLCHAKSACEFRGGNPLMKMR